MRDKLYEVPEYRRVRVLIDSDAACECDDHFAIAHALMSPKIEVVGIIAEHFGNRGEFNTMMASHGEIEELLKRMDATDTPLWYGADKPFGESGERSEIEVVKKIIAECNKNDDRPLFYIGQGAMTTLAMALKIEPKIASKMVCIATGGANYPEGGFEFNFMNDSSAADFVMKSELPVWMVPEEVY